VIVSINQPAYLPWLGYFERIAASDLHIVLDHVQFEKNSFTNRHRIRTAEGSCWLTVPVQTHGRFGELAIHELAIDNTRRWRDKHWRTIEQNYGRTPYFAEHAAFFESIYRREWTRLADLCRALTDYLLTVLDIRTPLCYSSDMDISTRKDELVLDLCRSVGATRYISGALGRQYLRLELFREAGIEVVFQDYHHPAYPQGRSSRFEPSMAAIDLLFNCGPESLSILSNRQEYAIP
jgi:hypothetical protein